MGTVAERRRERHTSAGSSKKETPKERHIRMLRDIDDLVARIDTTLESVVSNAVPY